MKPQTRLANPLAIKSSTICDSRTFHLNIVMAASFRALFALCFVASSCLSVESVTSCFDKSVKVKSIPDSHLYAKKQKPLVIGHHGNPSKFQENTVDGFKSLEDLKADGMELDTFLTKDGKLVVIHYDNTLVSQ